MLHKAPQHKDVWGSEDIVPLILNLSAKWKSSHRCRRASKPTHKMEVSRQIHVLAALTPPSSAEITAILQSAHKEKQTPALPGTELGPCSPTPSHVLSE